MATIGYGEDSLTYWALHDGRSRLLDALSDTTPARDCQVYYRPSFGRSGGPASPQFGEFDGILGTSRFVYLIESKWDSGVDAPVAVVLREVQGLRHSIFTWLYQRWAEAPTTGAALTWATFAALRQNDFAAQFPGRPLAPEGSLLARNLSHILTELTQQRRTLRNVLLYFYRQGGATPRDIVTVMSQPVADPPFRLVTLAYDPIGDSGYFRMTA